MPPIEDELAAIPQENPTGYRAIVRYEDIKRISRDPQTFCSGEGVRRGRRAAGDAGGHAVVHRDGRAAPHQAARARVRRRSRRGRWPGSRRASGGRASGSSPRPRRPAAATSSSLIAKRLPLQTISDMIGVPDADRERVVDAADTLVSRRRRAVPRRARAAGGARRGDLDALAVRRRSWPRIASSTPATT